MITRNSHRLRSKFFHHGFSLIEILVTVSIITILGMLLMPALKSARLSALRADDLGNMRQVGVAILAYAGDNDQQLPGPTPTGQRPVYYGTDRTWNAPNLAFYLAPYLGCPIPATTSSMQNVCPPLVNQALKASKGLAVFDQINYIVNYGTTNLPGDAIATWRRSLFGSTWYSPAIPPARLPTLAQAVPLNQIWMLCNVDQECTTPSIVASGWFSSLPTKPVHGQTRNFLFVDGHVEALSKSVQP